MFMPPCPDAGTVTGPGEPLNNYRVRKFVGCPHACCSRSLFSIFTRRCTFVRSRYNNSSMCLCFVLVGGGMSDGSVRPYLCLAWPAVRCAPTVAGKLLQKHLQCSRATLWCFFVVLCVFFGVFFVFFFVFFFF